MPLLTRAVFATCNKNQRGFAAQSITRLDRNMRCRAAVLPHLPLENRVLDVREYLHTGGRSQDGWVRAHAFLGLSLLAEWINL